MISKIAGDQLISCQLNISISFSKMIFYFFIFCIISTQLTNAIDLEDSEKQVLSCGLYGFRCLNEKQAQICDERFDDEGCTPRPRIFACAEGLRCDEEKKEFCSPKELPHHTEMCNCSKAVNVVRKKKSKKFHIRSENSFFDGDNEPTTELPQTTVDDDDEEGTNTEEPENDVFKGNPPIFCTTYGFFPGN